MNLQEAKELIKQHPGQFYTYLLKRPDGIPFYVGKGNRKGFRIQDHMRIVLSGKNTNIYKQNIIRKILEKGQQIDYEIVEFTNDESRAFDLEMELISFYGRKEYGGILANMTDGGEGVCGNIMSEKSKMKIRFGNKGKFISEETKQKIGNANRGKIRSKELRKRISIAQIGRICSGETRKKLSDSHKGIPHSEEHNRKVGEANRGKIRSPETRKKLSEAGMGHHLSEETKRKIKESSIARGARPPSRAGTIASEETKCKMRESWIRRKTLKQDG